MNGTTRTTQTGLETWAFDLAHSTIGFQVRHLVISKVHGRFARWTGSLEIDDADPARSKIDVTIDASSIDTHEPQRDAHLRSADFFDVEKHPEINFRSTRIERKADGRYSMTGDLTLHGVTQPVTLEAEYAGRAKDPWGGERAGFSAKGSIDRRAFGLLWNQALETGGVLVGERVEIELEIEAVRKAVPQAA